MHWPWRHSIINKFFISYLGIILLIFVSFFFYSRTIIKDFYISSISERMADEARIVGRLLPRGLQGKVLDDICRELASDLQVRLTVIAPDGKVLGDSVEPSSEMENHATRPEVLQAVREDFGTSIRRSTTVGYEMLYRALRQNGRIIRLSVPLADIEEVTGSIQRTILFGLLLASGLGLVLAFLFARLIGQRVKRMAAFSQRMTQGVVADEQIPVNGNDELSVFEHNLNEISRSFRTQMKELMAEKEKALSILRCMIEGVLVVDTEGRLIHLNERAQKMFRLSPSQTRPGALFIEISRHPEMQTLLKDVLAHRADQGYTKEMVLDEKTCFRVNAVSLMDEDRRILGYVLVFHDVTELKRLEQIRADFVANVSHELRTPVTAIRGYAETLLDHPPQDTEEARRFVGIIHRHSERLGRLIDDLLILSDLETGRVQLAVESVPVADLIGRVLELFQDQALKKCVRLSHEVASELSPIYGDADRLQQLLINLVDNAIKYTPPGGRVRVTAARTADSTEAHRGMIQLSVMDTGCGIPESELPRLTERFYRVDKARSRELGGTGLGLAIVKHVTQLHRGFLKVESQIGKGTTVSVFLPGCGPEGNGSFELEDSPPQEQ